MKVYADILVIVNLIVDFFLLSASARLMHRNVKSLRLLLGALIGGLGSLIVFLPPIPAFFQTSISILLCSFMTFAVFGFGSFFAFLKSLVLVLVMTCGYGGVMTAIWNLFHPHGMLVIGSVVYFDISPILLVSLTVFFYLLFTVFSYFFKRRGSAARHCTVTLRAGDKQISVKGLIDTGNSLEDMLGGGEVLIGNQASVQALFGPHPKEDRAFANRYRVIPCGTVSGGGMLDAYRCDSAIIQTDQQSLTLQNPLLALSKVPFLDDISILVNPDIFFSGG